MDTRRHSSRSMCFVGTAGGRETGRERGRRRVMHLILNRLVSDRAFSVRFGMSCGTRSAVRPPEPPRDKWCCHLAEHLPSLLYDCNRCAWSQSFHEYRGWFARRLAVAFSRSATDRPSFRGPWLVPRVYEPPFPPGFPCDFARSIRVTIARRCNRVLTSHG